MFMCDRTCDLFKVGNFNIKRCLLFLVCIMLLVACGENDPIESRNRHPRQQEESHSEQSGSVPAVAKEDVAAYFRFDMSRDINVALGLVEAQKETLQINGKMIKITEAVVKRKDYQKGSFVLYVTGTVNGSPFKNEFTFTGFVSKPDDYQMVNGAQAEWKANADYYAKLDFDSFYRLHKVNMFTIENLGRLVDFYSINVGGEKYLFTLEDLEKTVLEDIKYEQNQLSFYLRYNNSTKNPIAILRDDYRSNRSNLLNKWETSSLNRIQMELVRMGSMPIQNKDRHTFKALNSIEKKIKQLQEYEGCPDMSHEKQLLATYKYILSSPFDRKFGGLPPDEICGMLQQNGLSESNLPYQNYEGILQGRETVMYELATGKNGEKYLQPADQVKLNAGMSGISMDLISRFPAKEIPLPNLTESIQVSEKKEKLSIPKEPKKRVRKEKSKVKSVKIK